MNFCLRGGHIGGVGMWLPDDPSDFFRAAYGISAIGCNRLVCTRCGHTVRHASGYRGTPPFAAATLFAAREWRALKGAQPDVRYSGRLYACACQRCVAHREDHLDTSADRDPDWVPPWRCAGHPGFVPPGVIVGVDVDLANGWAPVVAAHLEETNDLHPSVSRIPGFTLTRIYQALQAPGDQHALALAVADCAADTSLRARQAVALFFALNIGAPGFERVLAAWRAEPSRYDGHLAAWGPDRLLAGNLLEVIAFRIDSRTSVSDDLLATWRWAALHAGLGVHIHRAARMDAAWTEEHVEQLLDAAPAEWKRILSAIRVDAPMRLVNGCRRAIASGHATRDEVATALTEHYGASAVPVIEAL